MTAGDTVSDRRSRLDLADTLIERFYRSWHDEGPPPPADDLEEALYHVQLLETTMLDDDPMFIEIQYTAGALHMDLWDLEGRPANLMAAIEHFDGLLEWLPTAGFLPALGRLLLQRHESDPDIHADDLETAVNVLRQAKYLPDADAETMYLLATALSSRIDAAVRAAPDWRKGDDWRRDADEAIELLSTIPPSMDTDEDTENQVAYQLGRLYKRRHLHDQADSTDLEHAITQLRFPAGSDNAARYELASSLAMRFAGSGLAHDREDAIQLFEQICADEGAPDAVYICGADMSSLYAARAEADQDDAVIDEVVPKIRWLLDGSEDEDGVIRVSMIEVLTRRFPPRRDEVAYVVELLDQLLSEGVAGDYEDSWLRTWRAMAFADLSLMHGDGDMLDRAIAGLHDSSRESLPEDYTQLSALEVVAVLIARRRGLADISFEWSPMVAVADFHSLDHLGLLDHIRDWCSSTPAGTPDAVMLWAARALLGASYFDEQTEGATDETCVRVAQGVIDDLTAALAALRQGDELSVVLRKQLAIRMADLARKNGDKAGCSAAVALFTELNDELPAGHPLRPEILTCLGAALISAHNTFSDMRMDFAAARDSLSEVLAEKDLSRRSRRVALTLRGFIKGQFGAETESITEISSGVGDYAAALRLIPEDGEGRVDVHGGLAITLLTRFQLAGDRADLEYSTRHIAAAQRALANNESGFMGAEELDFIEQMARMLAAQNQPLALAPDVSDLDDLRFRLFGAMTALAKVMDVSDPATGRETIHSTHRILQQELGNDVFDTPGSMLFSFFTMAKAIAEGDEQLLDESFEAVRQAADVEWFGSFGRRFRSLLFGVASIQMAQLRDDRAALDQGIETLEHVLSTGIPIMHTVALAAEILVGAYWRRNAPGDVERGFNLSQLALRQQARLVLIQSSTEAGLVIAAEAARTAMATTVRCLRAGLVGAAVAALESGRALALHAATSAYGLSGVLYQENHPALAEEWRRATTLLTAANQDVPDNLRHRVLDALTGSATEVRLLSPPSVAEIAEALSVADADYLVYLVPAQDDEAGRALLVSRTGEVDQLILPLLSVGEVIGGYLPATGEGLPGLCDRAWEAAIGPLARKLRTDIAESPPRVVLVPCGGLGVVPWHAARKRIAGGYRYFLAEAIVSYAASARQFREVAYRPRLPVDGAMVYIADPKEPTFHTSEWTYLKQSCYQHGEIYGLESWGQAGRGTCARLLAALPSETTEGAAVLHLTCHAESGSLSTRSHFGLDGGRVTVDEILRHAHGRPRGAQGGLVVAAACQTDLALHDHDEALTLTTALLAAGTTAVIGTKWSIDSHVSTVLTVIFHRELALAGRSPVEALRAAQLWALDPDREIPADLPDDLRTMANSAELAAPGNWAAFALHGR